jgi:ABC-type nickel/cobalt efflux system permease component RcnA
MLAAVLLLLLAPLVCAADEEEEEGRLLDVLADPDMSPRVAAWALLIAVFLGAAHALEPGHGKAVVAAYLVGSRGRIRHAVVLGLVVSVTHTIGVIALGLIALYAADRFVPGDIMPWMGVLSGAIIVGVGIYLLTRKPGHHHHVDGHAHHHGSPDHRAVDHEHDAPVGDRESGAITWGSIVALGISGGIVPCPAGIVIMLTAVSMGRTAFGLLVLALFSAGMAAVLVLVGVLSIVARPFVERWTGGGRVMRALPRVSALIIIALGIFMIVRFLVSGGIITAGQ